MRKAFTLIELMISMVILSIIMVFLYKSYAQLNLSNKIYAQEGASIAKIEQVKRVLFLDFLNNLQKLTVIHQDKQFDIVFLQSGHSVHDRINPYIGYIVNDKKLYRIESLQPLKTYPLAADATFDIDLIGSVKHFRVYLSKDDKNSFLIDMKLDQFEKVLMKI